MSRCGTRSSQLTLIPKKLPERLTLKVGDGDDWKDAKRGVPVGLKDELIWTEGPVVANGSGSGTKSSGDGEETEEPDSGAKLYFSDTISARIYEFDFDEAELEKVLEKARDGELAENSDDGSKTETISSAMAWRTHLRVFAK